MLREHRKNKRVAAFLLSMIVGLLIAALVICFQYRPGTKTNAQNNSQLWLGSDLSTYAVCGMGLTVAISQFYFVTGAFYGLVSVSLSILCDVVLRGVINNNYRIGVDNLFEALTGSIAVSIGLSITLPHSSSIATILFILFCSIVYTAHSAYILPNVLNFYLDTAGTISIYLYGSVFGLTASRFIAPCDGAAASSEHSELFRSLGYLFMFIMWPSVVIGIMSKEQLMTLAQNTNQVFVKNVDQYIEEKSLTVLYNVVFAMFGSLFACLVSRSFGKVSSIIRGSLIGAISVGSVSDVYPDLWVHFLLGTLACFISISVAPFARGKIRSCLGLNDPTYSIEYWIAPAFIGGLYTYLAVQYMQEQYLAGVVHRTAILMKQSHRRPLTQACLQLAAIGLTLAVSVMSSLAYSIICLSVFKCAPKQTTDWRESIQFLNMMNSQTPRRQHEADRLLDISIHN